MDLRKSIALLGLALAAAILRLGAAEPAKQTPFSTNEPLEVPGMMLAAGHYVFRLIEPQPQRNVLQVFETVQLWSADETHLLSTMLTMPNYDLPTTDKTVFSFFERGPKQPKALRIWFAPGRNYGQELVYPKAQAVELANSVGRAVLSLPPELPGDIGQIARMVAEPGPAFNKAPVVGSLPENRHASPAVVAPAPDISIRRPREAPRQTGPVVPPRTEPSRDNGNAAVVAQSRARAGQGNLSPSSLPKTNGSLPLIALLGVMGLLAGTLLRTLAQRLERK